MLEIFRTVLDEAALVEFQIQTGRYEIKTTEKKIVQENALSHSYK